MLNDMFAMLKASSSYQRPRKEYMCISKPAWPPRPYRLHNHLSSD